MLRVAPFLLLFLLAGCAAKQLEVNEITSIQPSDGTKGVDVYEKRRRAGEEVPEFAGDQIVPIRSYVEMESGARGDEFPGAKCKLEARDFSAVVTTPAKVRVPVYRAYSSPLTVSCEHPQYHKKLVERGVYNQTKEERLNAGASGGLAGVLIMAVVNEASDASNDEYYYGAVDVVMKPLDPKKHNKHMEKDKSGAAQ